MDRVLYAKVLVDPYKTVSIHIQISDLDNQSCRLCLYNYLGDYRKLKSGTCLAVLAPYMKHSLDNPINSVMLRCDHPNGVIIFECEKEWRDAILTQGTGKRLVSSGTFQQLKDRGNKEYRKRNFPLAISYYTAALEVALYSSNNADLVTSLSNRSQCYLNISAYAEPLADAERYICLCRATRGCRASTCHR